VKGKAFDIVDSAIAHGYFSLRICYSCMQESAATPITFEASQ
jgi:hypothetical protein